MCRVEYCDGYYIGVGLPDNADLTKCTDCGRAFGPDETPAEAQAFVHDEHLPTFYARITGTLPTDPDDDPLTIVGPFPRWLTAQMWDDSLGTDDLDFAVIEWVHRDDADIVPYARDFLVDLAEWCAQKGGEDWLPDAVREWCRQHPRAHDIHVTCAQCIAARRWLMEVCNGWVYDQIGEEIVEHWDEDTLYRNIGLGRMTLAIRRGQWRDRRGNLIPAETVRAWVDRSFDEMARREGLVPA